MTPLAVFRTSFQAYVDKDRKAIEAIVAEDFHFTSPMDNEIDRKTYFEICWPNSENMERVDEIFACELGNRACIVYEAVLSSGRRVFNSELATVRNGQLVSVQVYFGWDIPHKVPQGQHAAQRAQ